MLAWHTMAKISQQERICEEKECKLRARTRVWVFTALAPSAEQPLYTAQISYLCNHNPNQVHNDQHAGNMLLLAAMVGANAVTTLNHSIYYQLLTRDDSGG